MAEATVVIDAPEAKVWEALTDPAMIERYMFGARVDSEWTKGSRITWRGRWQGQPFEDHGVILDIDPGKLIRYTHYSRLSGAPDVPESYHTVTVRLSREETGTRVTLVQDNNETEEARAHSQGSWKMMLGGLKALVEG